APGQLGQVVIGVGGGRWFLLPQRRFDSQHRDETGQAPGGGLNYAPLPEPDRLLADTEALREVDAPHACPPSRRFKVGAKARGPDYLVVLSAPRLLPHSPPLSAANRRTWMQVWDRPQVLSSIDRAILPPPERSSAAAWSTLSSAPPI